MPAIKKAFDLMGDDIVELSTETESLKTEKGSNDEKWFVESKAKLLKQFDNDKRINVITPRMPEQMKKQ